MNQIATALSQIGSKDIALLAVGALISLLVKHLPGFIANYRNVTHLLGIWHAYHWSRTDGQPSFRCATWRFRRRIYGLRIDLVNADADADTFRGRVFFDGGDVLLELRSRKHAERVHYRLTDPIGHADTKMIGLILAIDYDREKYASIQLCVRKERTIEEAKVLIAAFTDLVPGESAVRVERLQRAENSTV
jgi:hypothetical protein